MTLLDGKFGDAALARDILHRIDEEMCDAPPVRLMEVCGTHTMAIGKFGLRRVIPKNLKLISGPGCPVCVTPGEYIDAAAELALRGAAVVTFGDMIRVPGKRTSLETARAQGGKIVIASSATAALDIARGTESEVVFLAVGFETTAPTFAAAVLAARRERLKNFSVLVSLRLVPPALRLVLNDPLCAVSGFILPGHVSAIIGTRPYEFLAQEFRVSGVVAGFELIDVLAAIEHLVRLVKAKRAVVANLYTRVVQPDGNPAAWGMVNEVFAPAAAGWRGIGLVPDSGLDLRPEFAEFDAFNRYAIKIQDYSSPAGCACGLVLRGVRRPAECPLFGKACTPATPVGPCMVSVEGACAVSHKYGEQDAG